MRRAEHIPVHRGAGTDASAVAALERGELVLVLPEGTISPAFELLPFRTGAAPDGTPQGAWWVPVRFGGAAPTPAQAEAYPGRLRSRWTTRQG